jgi:hypothetical protein
MTRIRLLSPYPLVTGADGRMVNPPLVVEAPPNAATQLIAAGLAEETDAEVEGEVNFAGFGDAEPAADGEEAAEPAAGKRRKG